MNDHTGVSEDEAREKVNEMIEEAWKKMNKLQNDPKNFFDQPFIDAATNLARIAQCTYQHGDSHGAPDAKSKNSVQRLIIDPKP